MDLSIALYSANPAIYFYGIQDMIRLRLVVSWRAGGHQDVFPAIYVRGKVILQSQGKEFFTWHGKDFFT